MKFFLIALILLIASLVNSEVSASTFCGIYGPIYTIEKVEYHEAGEPGRNAELVAYSTEPDFVVYALQSDFLSVAEEWGEKQPNQTDIHDLFHWVKSKRPSRLILLELFDADHSEKRRQFMMQLAEMGKVYVALRRSGRFIDSIVLEWFGCRAKNYTAHRGRRIRSESDDTILWIIDSIS